MVDLDPAIVEAIFYLVVLAALVVGQAMWKRTHPSKPQRGASALVSAFSRAAASSSEVKGRRAVLELLTSRQPISRITQRLKSIVSSSDMAPADWSWVLKQTEKNHKRLCSILFDMLEDVPLEPAAYLSALQAVENDNVARVNQILDRLKASKHEVNHVFFTAAIQQCAEETSRPRKARQQSARRALAVKATMESMGIEPDAWCSNAVIHALASAGLVAEAVKVLEELPGRGLRPTVVTYNSVMHACVNDKDRALCFLNDMEKHGLAPDNISYNTALAALAQAGDVKTANELLEKMKEHQLVPDLITWNSLISACATAGEWENAVAALDQMAKAKVQADAVSYNTAIHACDKAGEFEEAADLVKRMDDANVKPTRVTYNILVRSCVKRREWEEAIGVIRAMTEAGEAPDVVSFNTIIAGCSQTGDFKRACDLLQEMRVVGLRPDKVSYTAAIAACSRAQKFQEAVELVKRLRDDKIPLDTVLYRTVISVSDRADEWPRALATFYEMQGAGLVDYATYALIIRAAARRDPSLAKTLLADMRQAGFRPSSLLLALVP